LPAICDRHHSRLKLQIDGTLLVEAKVVVTGELPVEGIESVKILQDIEELKAFIAEAEGSKPRTRNSRTNVSAPNLESSRGA
jgi:hypothetical protein